MRLRQLQFDNPTADWPTSLTVEMTLDQAYHIAKVLGALPGNDPHCDADTYHCLSSIFNNHFAAGVDGYPEKNDR